jgi:hypothetical protein
VGVVGGQDCEFFVRKKVGVTGPGITEKESEMGKQKASCKSGIK